MENRGVVKSVKKWGTLAIAMASVAEVLFFFSIPNLTGVLMTWVCWGIFQHIALKEEIIREHVFAWLVFLSMSLYRILPLLATICEGKPIAYKFQVPYATFGGETFLYIVSALAFYFAIIRKKKNNRLQVYLYQLGYYEPITSKFLWIIGGIGLLIRLYLMSASVEIGNVGGKFLAAFTFFQYAPFLLFFPSLYKQNYFTEQIFVRNRPATIYFIGVILLSFATNSRLALLEPFGTIVLLVILSFLNANVNKRRTIKRYIYYGVIGVIVLIPFVSDISLAMLANRSIRKDVSRSDLFSATINTYMNREEMNRLRIQKERMSLEDVTNYSEGWTEEYIDYFAMNRYANMRITDITLFHADKVGFENINMQKNLWNKVLMQLPMPVLNLLGIKVDKVNIYSRGDFLYSLSTATSVFAGFRVTSHLGDGLATFGVFYFLIQYILFYILFILVDTFLIKRKGKILYSICGLIIIFDFLALFRNAQGCFGEIAYLTRGYWQFVIISLITIKIVRRFIH